VEFARHARFQAHRDASDALGNRQLLDRRFLAEVAAQNLALGRLQGEFECRQLLSRVDNGELVVGRFIALSRKAAIG
jgi:hypothetical protein